MESISGTRQNKFPVQHGTATQWTDLFQTGFIDKLQPDKEKPFYFNEIEYEEGIWTAQFCTNGQQDNKLTKWLTAVFYDHRLRQLIEDYKMREGTDTEGETFTIPMNDFLDYWPHVCRAVTKYIQSDRPLQMTEDDGKK